MQKLTAAMLVVAVAALAAPTHAQQPSSRSVQDQADKGIKTENSGGSGFVGEQAKPGSAAHVPGEPDKATAAKDAGSATSAQNSGAGISGAPGNKNGPAVKQGTVGSSQNTSVQQQDPANVQGLPGNKSGPPAKR